MLLDIAGNRTWKELTRVLADGATLVLVGGPKTNRWIGPMGHLANLKLHSLGRSRRVAPFLAKLNKDDLESLCKLLEDGSVTPVVERRYELGETADALSYLGEGHAQGKIVLTV